MTVIDTPRYLLAVRCPDRPGIVAAVATFLAERGFSITEAHQHESRADGLFFMRVAFSPAAGFGPPISTLRTEFAMVATQFAMTATIRDLAVRPRVLILVSKFDHCLNELLHRWRSGQLAVDIPAIVSNHDTLRPFVDWCGLPYYHLPVTPANKIAQEQRLSQLIDDFDIDLVVLARYMQILSPSLCTALTGRCINIHHSFLPSFKGARPYHQAYARGVKIIGATAHYVTNDLDEGPIIEQQTRYVGDARSPEALIEMGQEVESAVLARAVRWHVEGRVFANGGRTIVFN